MKKQWRGNKMALDTGAIIGIVIIVLLLLALLGFLIWDFVDSLNENKTKSEKGKFLNYFKKKDKELD